MIGLGLHRTDSSFAMSDGKTPGLKPGAGSFAKNSGQAFQRYFKVAEADTVSDTQRDSCGSNPGLVPVEKSTIAGTGVLYADKTVIGQLNTGMQTGERRVLKHEIT
jgi:hypothetical protein